LVLSAIAPTCEGVAKGKIQVSGLAIFFFSDDVATNNIATATGMRFLRHHLNI